MPKRRGKRFYHFYLGREIRYWFSLLIGFFVILFFTFGLVVVGKLTGLDLQRLMTGLVVSFGRVTISYIISLILGISIAFLVTRQESIENLLLPLFETAQSIPTVAILPLVVLWLGSGPAVIFLLTITIIWPITFSIISGFKSIPRSLAEAAKVYSAKGWRGFRHFMLPIILPSVITGSIIGWGEGWEVLVAAELLGAREGIGAYIGEASVKKEMAVMTVAIAFLMFFIFLLNKLVWVPLLKHSTKHQI
ncbi:MAG: ABC transporter permease [Candidatus Paceibacteria bacterium]